MWTLEIPFTSLIERNQWRVEFFCEPSSDESSSAFEMRSIKDLVKERRGTIEPSEKKDALINYVGLENIKSLTGQLVNFEPRLGQSIKSRSKLFYEDDVLYGRLRPNLNKVYHATGEVSEGICSGEFFVFMPNKELIHPIVLRYLLSSDYVQRHAARFQTGAALPRMNLNDLVNVKVPVPPLAVQEHYAKELETQFLRLVAITEEAEALPKQISTCFLGALETGKTQLILQSVP